MSWWPASPSMVGHREGLTMRVVLAGSVITWEGGAAPACEGGRWVSSWALQDE